MRRDLVSYDRKHNHGDGEDNRDGTDDNRSWNNGVEGPADDPAVQEVRARDVWAILVTLLLSRGVPMLLGGDEMGPTQLGNNNAYCQDNAISWFDWDHVDHDLLDFVRRTIAMRRTHPVLRHSGTSFSAGSFSQWPEPLGLAALHDDDAIRRFADIARQCRSLADGGHEFGE